MRLHRFFVEVQLAGTEGETVRIDEANLLHQWKNVFRLEKGDKVILLDNTGYEYSAEIQMLSKKEAEVVVQEKKLADSVVAESKYNTPEVWLYASLIKKDHYEWVLEKGTELGVANFVPVLSERSEKKELNIERAEKIITEAAEQSGKGKLPVLHDIVSLAEALSTLDTQTEIEKVAFHLDGTTFSKENFKNKKVLALFIGPEGGWSEGDLALFAKHKVPLYTLGHQVLRAETAAIAVAALLLL